MIKAIGSTLTYSDGTVALEPFDLDIKKGEVVFITGPSGSGKTSLLKLMMGSEFVTNGSFEVLGQTMKHRNRKGIQKMRQQIGPVFQEFRLLEGRTVYENVMLGLRFLDINAKEMKERTLQSIKEVGLEHKVNHTIDRLSWGENQRVAIARAVARKPKLIIADEPTGNLDHDNALNILRLLTSFKSDERSVIITTHATHLVDQEQNGLFITMEKGVITFERREENA